ncbi:VIT1/CCC1 transporter family protein [Salinarchaeum sp. IM2453]|uniref:VIT1/CCC1 transporter family protein n=1 Tax=Salinarchaeum sp. IM2453 TaxID=2862870 RepID=UPI001C83D255|nr:VIT1/CCC1 transporter family protein [Salinarchaeum sp. IM2453]QZA89306.1 VIT1/CCC1 transporter family protein [Salinarchaeum sp. IM2453]
MNLPTESFRRVLGKDDVKSLMRRYFVANGFDGTLTAIGVIVSSYLSGVDNGQAVIAVGLGAAVGLGISGIWSVWEIERAETKIEQRRVEEAMLTSLGDTRITRDLRYEQMLLSLASATGPVLAILILLTPFLFVESTLTMFQAVVLSIILAVLLLGIVGAYMGVISRQRWYVSALRMGLAGLVVAIISIFLPG